MQLMLSSCSSSMRCCSSIAACDGDDWYDGVYEGELEPPELFDEPPKLQLDPPEERPDEPEPLLDPLDPLDRLEPPLDRLEPPKL